MSDKEKIKSSDDETDLLATPPKKKIKHYEHKMSNKLLLDERFSSWLEASKDNKNRPYCKYCRCEIQGSVTHLERHKKTEKHIKNINASKQGAKVTDFLQHAPSSGHISKVAAAELKLCAFIAEHNLPVCLLDHLPGLMRNVCPDSKIAKDIKCARTKGTQIFKNILGPYYFENLVKQLKKCKFSLIIDETTDVSTKKQLVLLTRFYDPSTQQIIDNYLILLEVEDCSAKGLFASIESFFTSHDIPFKNLIGFASDNCSVMMGAKGGVQALLKNKVPSLFIQGCVCHSMHLCASKACSELPSYLEELARSIYSFLSNSSKRLQEYENFQAFTQTNPHKILHVSCTRWLSLEQVVKRILEQWPALVLFFTSSALEDNNMVASNVLKSLQHPITEMYYSFLAYILPDVIKINLEFQAESYRMHKLHKSLSSCVKGILVNFIKREIVKNKDLFSINISDPSVYLPINEVYLGAKVESIYIRNRSSITTSELKQFQIKTLNFYVRLAKEFYQRFFAHDFFPNLKLLEAVDPVSIREGNQRSIVPLACKFPNLVQDSEIELLNKEWRELTLQDNDAIMDETKPENYWYKISKENVGDKPRFPLLSRFMFQLLSLPHSSAAAERIFSLLTNIKVKNRSKLKTTTLNALLHTKSLLHDVNCTTYTPDAELCVQLQSKHWYKDEAIDETTF